MKPHYATLAFLLSLNASAQTVLFTEDFEGATPAFTLNTTDVGSIAVGANTWLINNVYTGGNGDLICLGFPLPYTIVTTPGQPGGITNANGKYMHTASVEGVTDGINNCSFAAPDLFGCITPGNYFTRMSTDVSTLGYSNVDLTFWWLCEGANNIFGEVYYSTDGGTSWILIGTPIAQYHNEGSWVPQTVNLAQFGNQATLRFGFRFVTAVVSTALDPGFGIDDIAIVAQTTAPNDIVIGTVSPLAVCAGSNISVPYTVTGAWSPGNVFTAELSDATGSFAAPVVIGSVAATTAVPFTCTIPIGQAAGTGYRIRITGSAPATISADNGVDITISTGNDAGSDATVAICKNTGIYDLLDLLGGTPDSCGTWTTPNGVPFNGLFDSASNGAGCYTYTANCSVGCPSETSQVCITLIDPANAGQDNAESTCSDDPQNLFNFVVGGDLTGLFWDGNNPLVTSPTTAGVYDLIYVVYATAPCINDTSDISITVNQAVSAGIGGTVTLCDNDPSIDLFTLLTGTPDANGTWTDPANDPFSGTFDPGVSAPGLYTYSVIGAAPCPNDDAELALVVDPCTGVGELAAPPPLLTRLDGQRLIVEIQDAAYLPGTLELLDVNGAVVLRDAVRGSRQEFQIGHLAPGAYSVRASADDRSEVVRIVIAR